MEYFILVVIALLNPSLGLLIAIIDLVFGKKKWNIDIICIALFFANLSYCYIPENSGNDLFRYFNYVLRLRGESFSNTVFSTYDNYHLYVFNLLVWFSNVFHDEHLLPAISSFFVYYIGFYCTCYYGQKEGLRWKTILLCLVIIALGIDWYSITNNVRNVFAFSIIGYAIFRDVYIKKKDLYTLLLYIIPIFIHPTAILFVIIRVVIIATRFRVLRTIAALSAIFVSPIVSFFYSHRLTSNPLINYVLVKAYNYLFDSSSTYGLQIQNSTRSLITRILFLCLVSIVCIIQFRVSNENKRTHQLTNQTEDFRSFVLLTGIMALACAGMLRPAYWRFSTTVVLFGGTVIGPFFDNKAKGYFDYAIKSAYLFVLSLCVLVVWYQLTWINVPHLMQESFINSPGIVLIKDVVNCLGG